MNTSSLEADMINLPNDIDINSTQIAKLVGVSRSTVSRVINNYPNVSEKTYKKVMKAINKYNYYPNLSAQVLKGKGSKTIGLFVISSGNFSKDIGSSLMISSVIENAFLLGYHVLTYVIQSFQREENSNKVKEIFYQRRIDGGIFIGAENHENVIEELIAEGFIVGVMDQDVPGRTGPNSVVVNFESKLNAKYAVDYLYNLNHRKIAFINGSMKKHSGVMKYKGFMQGIEEHKLLVPDNWITYGDFSEEGGYEATKQILNDSKSLPTAICTANDHIAFGAIRAIKEFGLSIPNDISIIGSDDNLLSEYYTPSLTTFRVDFTGILGALTTKIIEIIETKENDEFKITEFDTLFVERESCKRI